MGADSRETNCFFSCLLLREAAGDRWTPDRLRRWALLAARTALAAAVILFLARPGFRGALGAGHVRGVILLDASYSLRVSQSGETGFDRARNLARDVFQNRRPGDQWGLVVFSDRVESSFPPEADPAGVAGALEAATPTHRGTRFSAGFDEALKLLGGGGTVVLFSDAAAHGAGEGQKPWHDTPGGLVVVEVVSPRSNAAIVGSGPAVGRGRPAWNCRPGGMPRLERGLSDGTGAWKPGVGFAGRGSEGRCFPRPGPARPKFPWILTPCRRTTAGSWSPTPCPHFPFCA
ncbi:MAG: VWA domain-containing protein [Elusimicrobia bacterium]|nr:VWA domain-containing protein [Elusimicrobiota bacterium]